MRTNLEETVRLAQASWTGCSWGTEFGPRGLNLDGLQARQAMVAAKATRGEESQCWLQAAEWLAQVEKDAKAAAEHASLAIAPFNSGDIATALRLLDEAISIAAKYPIDNGYIACRAICIDVSCGDSAPA